MQIRHFHTARQRGISLIEVVVVMTIVAVLVAVAMPWFAGLSDRRALEGVAAELATDLRYVRTESLARNEAVSVDFEEGPAGSCYVIHTGTGGACHCLPGPVTLCDSGVTDIKTVALVQGHGASAAAGGAGTRHVRIHSNIAAMTFTPLNGVTVPAGSVTVSGPNDMTIRHVVSPAGRVRSCTAGAPAFGYRTC